ncbi:tRNA uridine-5-carboxymethylaminomethyl(34) synthesis GTPase MnmE [Balneolales bacterium ANBcel1]|nr:tRNA uridine-5-carboxymethylaminomethyl(34) synthesis GTPase MnmE [Balneolales bacterium ANBcel1]
MTQMTESSNPVIRQKPAIAAIATALGEAGISVIRVSGESAVEKVSQVFRGRDLAAQSSHTAHFGRIIEADRLIDEVVVTLFRSPKSYTGEDTVEISCHGGVLVTQEVLEALLRTGIRHAEPGEFTQRAFLNGKMELSQAEAVADMIHARSRRAVEAASQQLEGALGEHVRAFRRQIIDATAMVELELDFVEEDVEFADKAQLQKLLNEVDREIGKLLETYEAGRLVKHGVRTVFVGRPNAGKSTLMNTLIGKERAIVSATAGTTRDVIDADWSYGGLTFTLTDTAGLRETADEIESEGVRRSESAVGGADLIIYLKDVSEPPDAEEERLLKRIMERAAGKAFLKVGTKKDLAGDDPDAAISERWCDLVISAVDGSGIEELKKRMRATVLQNRDIDTGKLLVTSSRHRDGLEKARHHVREALKALDRGLTGDFLAIDLRAALNELGTITGEITTEDLLDSIFSRFCIGK